ncbi:hypothetical protein G7046_g7648 [Stylonectria norvegica]|nr:hypothetical protein G7046_g7648 [Stylonectria norvegica]
MPPRPLTKAEVMEVARLTVEQLMIDKIPRRVFADVPPAEQRQILQSIMEHAMRSLDKDPKEYAVVIEASVEKALHTSYINAEIVSGWNGHKDMLTKLLALKELKDKYPGTIWMVPANYALPFYALRNIRQVRGRSDATALTTFNELGLWKYVGIAIDAWPQADEVFQIEMSHDHIDMEVDVFGDSPKVFCPIHPPTIAPLVNKIALIHENPYVADPRQLKSQQVVRKVTLTRQDALDAGKDVVDKIGVQGHRQPTLKDQVNGWLNPYVYQVLPKELQDKVICFAEAYLPDIYEDLAKLSPGQLEQIEYEEFVIVEVPAMTSDQAIDIPCKDLRQIAAGLLQTDSKMGEAMYKSIHIFESVIKAKNDTIRRLFQDQKARREKLRLARLDIKERQETLDKQLADTAALSHSLTEALDQAKKQQGRMTQEKHTVMELSAKFDEMKKGGAASADGMGMSADTGGLAECVGKLSKLVDQMMSSQEGHAGMTTELRELLGRVAASPADMNEIKEAVLAIKRKADEDDNGAPKRRSGRGTIRGG